MQTRVDTKAGFAAPAVGRKYLYGGTVALMALSGFGQMPIYKRYYLSDIPGLGWLADFYVTRNVHYLGAVVLLALAAYALFDFRWSGGRFSKLTRSGLLRGWLLAGITATGALIVVKNFPYVHFPDAGAIALNLIHIGLVMAFSAAQLACLILKKRWTAPG